MENNTVEMKKRNVDMASELKLVGRNKEDVEAMKEVTSAEKYISGKELEIMQLTLEAERYIKDREARYKASKEISVASLKMTRDVAIAALLSYVTLRLSDNSTSLDLEKIRQGLED